MCCSVDRGGASRSVADQPKASFAPLAMPCISIAGRLVGRGNRSICVDCATQADKARAGSAEIAPLPFFFDMGRITGLCARCGQGFAERPFIGKLGQPSAHPCHRVTAKSSSGRRQEPSPSTKRPVPSASASGYARPPPSEIRVRASRSARSRVFSVSRPRVRQIARHRPHRSVSGRTNSGCGRCSGQLFRRRRVLPPTRDPSPPHAFTAS